MKPALIALAAAVALLVAHILRDRATDARLALLDDSDAVGEYVPMAAWTTGVGPGLPSRFTTSHLEWRN